MNLLLHEAIVVVLINCQQRTATIEEIAGKINKRKLYVKKNGDPVTPAQIKLRASLSGGRYTHLFTCKKTGTVTLR